MIVKPRHSRIVNSERYLVARFRRPQSGKTKLRSLCVTLFTLFSKIKAQAKAFVDALCKVHASWDRPTTAAAPAAATTSTSSTSTSTARNNSSNGNSSSSSSSNSSATTVNVDDAPIAVVPIELMQHDERFRASLSACATRLCERQVSHFVSLCDTLIDEFSHHQDGCAAAGDGRDRRENRREGEGGGGSGGEEEGEEAGSTDG